MLMNVTTSEDDFLYETWTCQETASLSNFVRDRRVTFNNNEYIGKTTRYLHLSLCLRYDLK